MDRNKVYTLTLKSGLVTHDLGHQSAPLKKQFAISPCPAELPQNVRMLCIPVYAYLEADEAVPSALGELPIAVQSDMFQPLSFDSQTQQAKTLCYLGRESGKNLYTIANTGPPQQCVVTSPFGKHVTIELTTPTGTTLETGSAFDQFKAWTLVLEFKPIIEDEGRMDMMKY